jgi:hypothetical protein
MVAVDKVTETTTIRGTKIFDRESTFMTPAFDLMHCLTFVIRFAIYPDFFRRGVLEKVIDMPEETFFFLEMTIDSG